MNDRRGFRSEGAYGMGYRNEGGDWTQDRGRYGGRDWSSRERQGFARDGERGIYGRGEDQGYGYGGRSGSFRDEDRDGPGMWDRMKGEIREGWHALTGDEDERRGYGGRGYDDRGYGDRGYGGDMRREHPFGYAGMYGGGYGSGYASRSDLSSGYGYGRNTDDMGYGSMHGGYRGGMRSQHDDRGLLDRAREGMREGWNDLKETFAGKGPKGYKRSDDRIREDVCEQLTRHPSVDASEVDITVREGEVTLTGTVPERHMKRIAEDIAEDVSGVKEVTNQIRVSREMRGSSASTTGNRDVMRDNGTTTSGGMGRTMNVGATTTR